MDRKSEVLLYAMIRSLEGLLPEDKVKDWLGCLKAQEVSTEEPMTVWAVEQALKMALLIEGIEKNSIKTGKEISIGNLGSVFNRMNGRDNRLHYEASVKQNTPMYPVKTPAPVIQQDIEYVCNQIDQLLDSLKTNQVGTTYILEVMGKLLAYLPVNSSDSDDISLFDHVKTTAAVSACLLAYLQQENMVCDGIQLKEPLSTEGILKTYDGKNLASIPCFLLYSMDLSGIQSFIYQLYDNSDVLKNLRARSFYLELMMQNAVDELLDHANLTRANLIYAGGGHSYMLLPNTLQIKETIQAFELEQNQWLLETFHTDLFLGCGQTVCSAEQLSNHNSGEYHALFAEVSRQISLHKRKRYSAADLIKLNQINKYHALRECRICHRSDHLTEDDVCEICRGLITLARSILEQDRFTIKAGEREGLPIGKDQYVYSGSEQTSTDAIRTYQKNRPDMHVLTIQVSDYCAGQTLGQLVEKGRGIRRLGVLRADVDNLGQAFVSGLPEELQTLSRAATFSRMLSSFFKQDINELLRNGHYFLSDSSSERSAAVLYAGGDDLFIVGAWADVFEFAIDLYCSFSEFTGGALTISAGFGIFPPNYPISYMAEKAGDLEERAKENPGKNSIALFDEHHVYTWDCLIDQVLGKKYRLLNEFFQYQQDRGNSFLYHILDLLRNQDERLNLARLAYVLGRMEPGQDALPDQKELYQKFSRSVYQWMKDPEECRQLITAIYIYAYLVRESKEEES